MKVLPAQVVFPQANAERAFGRVTDLAVNSHHSME